MPGATVCDEGVVRGDVMCDATAKLYRSYVHARGRQVMNVCERGRPAWDDACVSGQRGQNACMRSRRDQRGVYVTRAVRVVRVYNISTCERRQHPS